MNQNIRSAAIGGLAATFVVAVAFAPRLTADRSTVEVQQTSSEAQVATSEVEATTTTLDVTTTTEPTTTTTAPRPTTSTTAVATTIIEPLVIEKPAAPTTTTPPTPEIRWFTQVGCPPVEPANCHLSVQVMSSMPITGIVVNGHVLDIPFTLNLDSADPMHIAHGIAITSADQKGRFANEDVVIDNVDWQLK